MNNDSGIYALKYDGDVVYIGQAKSIKKRYAQHCSLNQNRSNRLVSRYLYELIKKGEKPELVVIEQTEDLDAREIHWISEYRKTNPSLLNMSDGGKTMQHLSRAKKAKPWGNTHSPVQRRLLSIKRDVRTLRRLGQEDAAKRIEEKLMDLNDVIKRTGLDVMNMRLWEKYGN